MSNDPIKLSIILPVRNEALNLRIMLKMLKASISFSHEVLIVFDDPQDNSLPVVESILTKYPVIQLIHNEKEKGVAGAIRLGIKFSKGEYILVLTADDPGPIVMVEKMLSLMEEGFDLVSASRYRRGGYYIGGHWLSRCLSRWANKFFYLVSYTVLTDATFGIKMFRRDLINTISFSLRKSYRSWGAENREGLSPKAIFLDSQIGWSIAFELSIKAQLNRWRMKEVAVTSLNRLGGGSSSFRPWAWIKEYTRWLLWAVKKQYEYGQLRFQIKGSNHEDC